jgi:deoxycytidine triphosphate deaminase
VKEATIWDVKRFKKDQEEMGSPPILGVAKIDYKKFANKYAVPVPDEPGDGVPAYRHSNGVVLEPGGLCLWQTREEVGTPEEDARYICFVDGKSTRARTGLLVHLTAPTIHAGWWGKITLELANVGDFRLLLSEGDSVAQIVVAMISSPPLNKKSAKGVAVGQHTVAGESKPPAAPAP